MVPMLIFEAFKPCFHPGERAVLSQRDVLAVGCGSASATLKKKQFVNSIFFVCQITNLFLLHQLIEPFHG